MGIAKKLISMITDMKIRRKLIGVYIISVLIPILLVGIYLANNMRNIMIQRTISEAGNATDRLQYRITELTDTVMNISNRIILDENVKDIVSKEYENHYAVMIDYFKSSLAKEYILYRSEIDKIRIYAFNETLLSSGSFINTTPEINASDWYQEALDKKGRATWGYLYDDIAKENKLCLYRRLMIDDGVYAVLVISLKDSCLRSLIRDESFATIISVNYGDIFLAADSALEGTRLNIPDIRVSEDTIDGEVAETEYGGESSFIITNSFYPYKKGDDNFQIFTIAPVHDIIGEANKVQSFAFGLIAASLFFSILLILFFTGYFSKRMDILRREMHRVVAGDFTPSQLLKGKDEIGELQDDLNKIIQSINTLINEVYEEKLQSEMLQSKQNEAEFKMLASQINPHFLYNTLEAVRMRALCNGQKEIADVIKLLGKSMRRIIEVRDELVSLDTEIDHVVSYLEIQIFRYGEKCSYEIHCKPDLDTRTCYILPLLLQPVVENAFIHGIEDSREKGKITINIQSDGDTLSITVEDNGTGINEDKLNELHQMVERTGYHPGESIGLCNVNQRIKLYYGQDYGLKITSKWGFGTRVSIHLPLNGGQKYAQAIDR